MAALGARSPGRRVSRLLRSAPQIDAADRDVGALLGLALVPTSCAVATVMRCTGPRGQA
jgi:hypothetical protein